MHVKEIFQVNPVGEALASCAPLRPRHDNEDARLFEKTEKSSDDARKLFVDSSMTSSSCDGTHCHQTRSI